MLKPEPMCRVSIIGSKSVMKQTIDTLYDLKIIHLEDFYKDRERALSDKFQLEMGVPFGEADGVASALVRLRSISSRLPQVSASDAGHSSGVAPKQMDSLEREILSLTERLRTVEDERSRILSSLKELEPFEGLPIKLEYLSDYKSLSVFAGFASSKKTADETSRSLDAVSPRSRVFTWVHGGNRMVLAFTEHIKAEMMRKALVDTGYIEVNFSGLKALKGTAADNLLAIRRKENELAGAKDRINAELSEIGRKWFAALRNKEKELVSASERAQAPLRFAVTKSTFIADGWVPCGTYDAMATQLDRVAKGNIYIEKSPDSDNAPVKLKHPRPVEPFEFFMNLYSLPKYNEIDPTFFMFLTFPLFFGMMLGDIGYGLVTTAIFLLLRKNLGNSESRALINVMLFASVASIIFGMAFGEFFGEEVVFGVELPHIISRVEGMEELILVTAGMGLVQLNLGFLLGFVNKFREHGFIHALLEKGSWFVIEGGIALLAASYMKHLSVSNTVGIVITLIGVIMLFKGEGIKGLVEIPSLLSNTLSYTRIMAVGLASVSLALVVNELAGGLFEAGGLYAVFGVVVLFLGHTINLALGILGPFLHSLRLHYVEFFTKFFEGGGKKYQPFGE